MQYLSKTDFVLYLECPKNAWVKKNLPEVFKSYPLTEFEQSIIEKGPEIETWAKKLFPGGIETSSDISTALEETNNLMQGETPIIHQATFFADGYLAKVDTLKFNEQNGLWDIYEVKADTKDVRKSKIRIPDLFFQKTVLKKAGVKIGNVFLVNLNKEFIKKGDINPFELFKFVSLENLVLECELKGDWELQLIEQMEQAKKCIFRMKEGDVNCSCIYQCRANHCTTFAYSNPEIPDPSVHDIGNIRTKKLIELIDSGIIKIEDVHDGIELSASQRNQVTAHANNQIIRDFAEIKSELSKISYPIYFFDYEANQQAVPIYDGFSPYQQIPFQFSLHILRKLGGELEHFEYLHKDNTDPSLDILEKLDEYIKSEGTVVVWSKTFERTVNLELAKRHPEFEQLIERINSQIYDLRDIFLKQFYVHPGFKGKTSIKFVLPVMTPRKYKDLAIQDGGTASKKWFDMVFGKLDQEAKLKVATDLKQYCGTDTIAMYDIWEALNQELIQNKAL